MKAILINANEWKVEEVDLQTNEDGQVKIEEISRHVQCDYFDVARIGNGDGIFVDDNGLNRTGVVPCFQHKDYPQALAGNGLVLGCDASGNSIPPKTTLQEVTDFVQFGIMGLDPETHN
jgi:hypothetical protein